MNAKRATALGALAVLALGMSACAPGAPTEPSEPTTPVTESTTAAAPESTTAPAPAPTSEPAPTTPSEEPPAEDPTSDSPSDTPFITPADGDLPGAAACYVDGEPRPGLEGADIPAAGAVKAWLCGDAPGGYGTVGPMEPLLTGVDGIIDAFTQLPGANPEGPQEVAGIYRIVFEYADGSYAMIEGDDQTDGPVWVGDNRRAGGEQFLNQVRGLWLDQRLAVGDPAEPAVGHATVCPAPEHYIVAHPVEDTVGGWLCAGNSEELTALEMDPELAQQVAAELRENSTQAEGNLPATGTTVSLMVPWGEATLLRMLDNEPGFLWASDQGAMKYTPSPDVDAALRAAIVNQ